MSWNTYHRRGDTLREVVARVNDRRDGVLPMTQPGVAENFADELDLLGALQLKWHARLSGNIERALVREPWDLEAAVSSAWRTTAREMAGVRLVIDRCTDQPTTPEMAGATARASRLERLHLARAAGLASSSDDAAVQAGRRVEDRARQGLATEAPSRDRTPHTPAHRADDRTQRTPRRLAQAAIHRAVQRVTRRDEGRDAGRDEGQVTTPDAADTPGHEAVNDDVNESFVDRIKAVLAAA